MKLILSEQILTEIKEKNYAAYYWGGYFKNRFFPTQEDLIQTLQQKINHANKGVQIGTPITLDFVLQFIDIVQMKSGWTAKMKQKFRYNENKSLVDNWDQFEIIHTPYEKLVTIGDSNFNDYEIGEKIKKFKISDFLNVNDNSYHNHANRIKNLSRLIIENKQFEPIVVEPNQEWVIEGQHRIRALNLLKFKTVLAYEIVEIE